MERKTVPVAIPVYWLITVCVDQELFEAKNVGTPCETNSPTPSLARLEDNSPSLNLNLGARFELVPGDEARFIETAEIRTG